MTQLSENEDTIQENHWVIIKMPSGNKKLILLKKDITVSLGKFGNFESNSLIGQHYGKAYEIESNNTLSAVDVKDEADEFIELDFDANNEDFTNDNTAQKLSKDVILDLKRKFASGEMKGDDVIETLVQNNESFEKRSEFSKAKYIKKKKKKFSKIFEPLKTRVKQLQEYFALTNSSKIWDMRMDTLSQMLSMSNTRSGMKALIIDDTQGLILSAFLERMGGNGSAVVLHDQKYPNADVLRYLNFPSSYEEQYLFLQWTKVHSTEYEEIPLPPEQELTEERKAMYQRKVEKLEKYNGHLRRGRESLNAKDFDCFVIASKNDLVSIIQSFSVFLDYSKPIVLYSPYKEPLVECYAYLRGCKDFINVQLTESWHRRYQTLPGRMHPEMTTSASGGYLLSAIKVLNE